MVERSRRTRDMKDITTLRMTLATAALAVVAALFAGGANAMLLDGGGAADLGAPAPSSTIEPGTIPYLSHGIGVDESLFSGQTSPGLTGDSALTRVEAPEPAGLTGDSALTRVDEPVAATGQQTSSGSDTDWTWIGFGAGTAALLAAVLMGLYLSARHRGRVALP
jgi:hypothetical protein